jgi:hypothetical protein
MQNIQCFGTSRNCGCGGWIAEGASPLVCRRNEIELRDGGLVSVKGRRRDLVGGNGGRYAFPQYAFTLEKLG